MKKELSPYVKRSNLVLKCAVEGCSNLGFREDGCLGCGEYRCDVHAKFPIQGHEQHPDNSVLLGGTDDGEQCFPCFNFSRAKLAKASGESEASNDFVDTDEKPPNLDDYVLELHNAIKLNEVRNRFWLLYLSRFKEMTERIDELSSSPLEQLLWGEFFIRRLDRYYDFQVELFDNSGGYIVRADFASLLLKIAIFTDGRTYHSSPEALSKDKFHNEELKKLGWTVRRYWTEQVQEQSEVIADEIYQLTCIRLAEIQLSD